MNQDLEEKRAQLDGGSLTERGRGGHPGHGPPEQVLQGKGVGLLEVGQGEQRPLTVRRGGKVGSQRCQNLLQGCVGKINKFFVFDSIGKLYHVV